MPTNKMSKALSLPMVSPRISGTCSCMTSASVSSPKRPRLVVFFVPSRLLMPLCVAALFPRFGSRGLWVQVPPCIGTEVTVLSPSPTALRWVCPRRATAQLGGGVKHCALGEVTLGATVDNAVVWQYGCNGERKSLCLATACARVIVRSVCICHLYTFV